jgi:hypothetical protein
MTKSDKDRAAQQLVEWHYEIEPGLELVYRVVSEDEDDPKEPIKLVEINSAAVGTGSFEAFAFAPSDDIPYTTVIAELTHEQLQKLRADGALPPGWNLDTAIEIPRPVAA